MLNLYVRLKNWFAREEGQGMTEYALIIGLVAVGVIALLTTMGDSIITIFTKISGALTTGAAR